MLLRELEVWKFLDKGSSEMQGDTLKESGIVTETVLMM